MLGGFYERLVKSVRTPLKKICARAMLDAEQLTTILAEIEAQLNTRPLTYLSADPNGLQRDYPCSDSQWEKSSSVSR